MIIGAMPRRPLILIGNGWQTVFDQVYRSFDEYIPSSQRGFMQFAADVRSAVELLDNGIQ
jgi:hypothetical protein